VKSGNDTLAAWPDGHLIYTAPESEIPTTTKDATQPAQPAAAEFRRSPSEREFMKAIADTIGSRFGS
jgi:hypothetical protein